MASINLDLEDGKPALHFILPDDDADRFTEFMAHCNSLEQQLEALKERVIRNTNCVCGDLTCHECPQ